MLLWDEIYCRIDNRTNMTNLLLIPYNNDIMALKVAIYKNSIPFSIIEASNPG